MKHLRGLLAAAAGIAVLTGVAVLAPTQASASVVKNSFLTTKHQISTTNSKKQVKITIPKGTTVRVAGIKTSKGSTYVYSDADRLNYNLRKPVLSTRSTSHMTYWQKLTSANYTHVAKPKYLDYYSLTTQSTAGHSHLSFSNTGNLWLGSALPVNYTKTSGTRLRITDDGYLEYYSKTPYSYKISPKPTHSVKVQSATHPGGSGNTILTTKSSFSQLPFTKLATDKYQLTIHLTSGRTTTVYPSADNATKLTTQQISTIGGTKWFAHTFTSTFLG